MRNRSIRETVPVCTVGGMKICRLSRTDTVRLMGDVIAGRFCAFDAPLFMTSSNGQVLSQYALSAQVRKACDRADIVSADGQSLVIASRLFTRRPIADRSCTTDLFHDAATALPTGTKFFLLGAAPDEMDAAAKAFRTRYPHIDLVGHSHGYLSHADEQRLFDSLERLKPDILWIGMGVPLEQEFVARYLGRLSCVKIVKTAGGLFNYVSGTRSRAPLWMRKAGLEWVYRLMLEPQRLAWRYLVTNPHGLFLLLTRTRSAS